MSYQLSTSIHWHFDSDFKRGIKSIEEPITRITKAGFKFLDFNFLDHTGNTQSPFLGDDWEEYIAFAGEVAAKNGASFNQAHAPCHIGLWPEGFGDDEKQKYIERAVIACSILGIKQMAYHPILAWNDPNWEQLNRDFVNKTLEVSHKYNVGMALENLFLTNKCPLSRPENLIEFVDSFNDPLLGICWDTSHGNFTKDLPELEKYKDQYKMITGIGKRLKALHISDNSGMGDDHIAPFDGKINWKDVMRALKDIDYQYSFTYETNNAINRIPASSKELVDSKMRYMYLLGQMLVSKEFLEQ